MTFYSKCIFKKPFIFDTQLHHFFLPFPASKPSHIPSSFSFESMAFSLSNCYLLICKQMFLIVFSCYWLLWFNKTILGNRMGRMLHPWDVIIYNFGAWGLYQCSSFPRVEERQQEEMGLRTVLVKCLLPHSLPPLQSLTIFTPG